MRHVAVATQNPGRNSSLAASILSDWLQSRLEWVSCLLLGLQDIRVDVLVAFIYFGFHVRDSVAFKNVSLIVDPVAFLTHLSRVKWRHVVFLVITSDSNDRELIIGVWLVIFKLVSINWNDLGVEANSGDLCSQEVLLKLVEKGVGNDLSL